MPKRLSTDPLAVFAALSIVGCYSGLAPGSLRSEPALVVVLTAGAAQHRLVASWTTPADSAQLVHEGPRPIAATDLAIWIEGPGGVEARPIPVSDSAGVYALQLTVVPGTEYRLVGSIRGVPVTGTTRTPGPIQMVVPANDTIEVDDGLPDRAVLGPIQYHVRSLGARAAAIGPDPGEFVFTAGDTTGVWYLFGSLIGPGTTLAWVHAYDPAATAFLFRRATNANLTGAVGVFGSKAVRPITLRRR